MSAEQQFSSGGQGPLTRSFILFRRIQFLAGKSPLPYWLSTVGHSQLYSLPSGFCLITLCFHNTAVYVFKASRMLKAKNIVMEISKKSCFISTILVPSSTWHSSQSGGEAQLVASPLGGKEKSGTFIQPSGFSGTSLKNWFLSCLTPNKYVEPHTLDALRMSENKRDLSDLYSSTRKTSADKQQREQKTII